MAKYSKKAQNKVEKVMHEMKKGKLRSGGSGKKVTSRKQAIAIGLSEAREAGAKVPKKKPVKKSAGKRSTAKKSVTTKMGTMKRKRAIKKTAPKKTVKKKIAKKKGSR